MTAPAAPRGIEALDVPLPEVEAAANRIWAERDRRIAALHDRQLATLRESLPFTDLDRHTLDLPADDAFAHLAPGYPQAVAR